MESCADRPFPGQPAKQKSLHVLPGELQQEEELNTASAVSGSPFGFVDDTSLPVSSGSGKAIPQLYGKKAILKIVGDRTAVDGSTEYKVVWRQRGKRDSWLPASSFEMKYIADHVRKSRSFKKRKLVRKAAQQLPYSH
jgi:hypothetical protein